MVSRILTLVFLLCAFLGNAQTNSSAKSFRSYNADSLTVQTETTGLESMYDSVGVIYYNRQASPAKWRVYQSGQWYDLLGGGGGGGTITGATNGNRVIGGNQIGLGGTVDLSTVILSTASLGIFGYTDFITNFGNVRIGGTIDGVNSDTYLDFAGNDLSFSINGDTGLNGQVLTANGSGSLTWQNVPGLVTASNGLNVSGSDVRLGGSLTGNVNITGTQTQNVVFGSTTYANSVNNFQAFADANISFVSGNLAGGTERSNFSIDPSAVTYSYRNSAGTIVNQTTLNSGGHTFQVSGSTRLLLGTGSTTFNLGSDATGDMYYRNSSGFFTRLPVGTNGHVLTLSAGLPSWQVAGGGITNGAAINEIPKTVDVSGNLGTSGIYSTSDGDILLGSSSQAGNQRTINPQGTNATIGTLIGTKNSSIILANITTGTAIATFTNAGGSSNLQLGSTLNTLSSTINAINSTSSAALNLSAQSYVRIFSTNDQLRLGSSLPTPTQYTITNVNTGSSTDNNGADLVIIGAGAYTVSGNGLGGNLIFKSGQGFGSGKDGDIVLDRNVDGNIVANLPTSDPLSSDAFWNDNGVVTVSGSTAFTPFMRSRDITSADNIDNADNFYTVYLNSGSPFNLTIDQMTINSQVYLVNIGAGTVTFVNGSGVTSSGLTTLATGEKALVLYRSQTAPLIL